MEAGRGLSWLVPQGVKPEAPAPAQAEEQPASPLAPKPPHFAGKVKSVIYLGMVGAPSQLDTWDYKPKLREWQT